MEPEHVRGDELIARFVFQSNWIRKTNPPSVKPAAFVPYPYAETSVTRHDDLPLDALWEVGQAVGKLRAVTMYGRADVTCSDVRREELDVKPYPIPGNINHAVIVGWASDERSRQTSQAQKLAAKALFLPTPTIASGSPPQGEAMQ